MTLYKLFTYLLIYLLTYLLTYIGRQTCIITKINTKDKLKNRNLIWQKITHTTKVVRYMSRQTRIIQSHKAQLALVTRDLILAFPVTYLAKTRLNLL